jgi:hypothetical protein
LRQIFSDHLFHFAIARHRYPCLLAREEKTSFGKSPIMSASLAKPWFHTKPTGKQVFLDRF